MDTTVASTIIEQLGGLGRLRTMVGAGYVMGSDDRVTFRFKMNRRMDTCVIILTPMDTYTMQFWKGTAKGYKLVAELKDVYCEDLIPFFEQTTGLYLTLGRIER